MRTQAITVDINKQTCKIAKYKQYDNNNLLRIIVVKDYYKEVDLTDYSGFVFFKLPSGLILEKNCTINKNVIDINIDNSILVENGKAICEVTLCDKEKVTTLFKINIVIEESIDREEAISTNTSMDIITEFAKMNEKIEKIENLDVLEQITQEDINKWDNSKGMTDEEKEQMEKNTDDILKIMKAVDEPPIYTKPTINLSSSKTTVEHNVSTSIILTPNFNQNDAGGIISYSLSKNGTIIYSNSSTSAYTDNITLLHNTSISYSAVVNYGDGIIKNTLLGIEYPSTSIKKGSISNSVTVKGYSLSYYGVINSDNIDGVSNLTSVLRTSKGSTLTFNMVNQRTVYMYPKSFGNLTSIKDANNFEYINSYTLSTMTLDGVEYNVYILTDAVTINGFKQIFS